MTNGKEKAETVTVLFLGLQNQCCILSPCLFNFYAKYIMRNAGLGEAQTGIKTAGRNINNLRHADDKIGRAHV